MNLCTRDFSYVLNSGEPQWHTAATEVALTSILYTGQIFEHKINELKDNPDLFTFDYQISYRHFVVQRLGRSFRDRAGDSSSAQKLVKYTNSIPYVLCKKKRM